MAKVNAGLRIEERALEELAKLAKIMTVRAGGAEITVATAARTALDRGIAVLLAELGGEEEPKKGGKAPHKAK